MDCLLQLTAMLCLVQPSQLALRTDVSRQIAGDVHHWSGRRDYGGATLAHIGVELPVIAGSRFSINLGYVHESLLQTRSDRGEERVSLGLVWQPFK